MHAVNTMLSNKTLPNWLLPDGEEIGIDEAWEIIAWIRKHAGPVLEEAERALHER